LQEVSRKMRRFGFSFLTVVGSTVLCLLVLEVGVRVGTEALTEWRNYATEPVNLIRTTEAIDFDSEVGWVQKRNRQNIVIGAYRENFGPFGNRLHKPVADAGARPILAVGDSFTFGSEVGADESWPALLEQITGTPVVNGGVGGYGVDQVVLWAERLAPVIKPRLIVFSFIPNDITRARMSVFSGASKPFFRVVDGKLQAENLPLQMYKASVRYAGVSAILGYSKLADWVAARLGLTGKWRLASYEFRYEIADEVQTSCAFMGRLAKIGVPAVVVAEYGWNDLSQEGKTGADQTRAVLACAKAEGMEIVDTADAFRAVLPAEFGAAYKYYVNGKGHMTREGNAVVAGEIAKAINRKGSNSKQ
jgi:hypothetical protein